MHAEADPDMPTPSDQYRISFATDESSTLPTTTRHDLQILIATTFEQIHTLNDTKGREYASDDDATANFKNRASQLGIDPLAVWGIFFGKHIDAIYAYIRTGQVLSEPIEGRIDDAILYLILLKALVGELAGEQA